MTDSWDRAKQLFYQALERPVADRERFLAEQPAAERAEVESLLAALDRAPSERRAEQPGERIGHYRLQQRIGEGGFGTVWMAQQIEPIRRQVALKVVKLGMDTDEVLARFEVERQALALMDHPSIARVLDAGATDRGRPYFAMELVRGVPMTRYCDEQNLATRRRLELFCQVCQAVHHAHQKGIIHRDLKPSNVMVTQQDGEPLPKVIDFGIAKATTRRLTEKTVFTQFGVFLGTPEYMAPEQTEISDLDVDTRADVYSLGVLLYELVTGTKPFELRAVLPRGYSELIRVIREEDPPKPSTRIGALGEELGAIAKQRGSNAKRLGKLVEGELDWIVMKAIEKDRRQRYDSAGAFAADVRRHLRDEPLVAGPPTAAYRLRKYVRRHRVAVLTGSLVGAALLIGTVVSTLGLWSASERAAEAKASAVRAETVVQLLTDMLSAADPSRIEGPHYTVRQLLDDFDAGLGDRLSDQREVQATVHQIMARAYTNLAAFERAEHHADAALAAAEAINGDSDLVVTALLDRARIDTIRGDYAAATAFLTRAEETWRRPDRAPDVLFARLLSHRAEVARHQNDLERAESWAREAVVLLERRGGDDPARVTGLLALGHVLETRGDIDEAERTFRQAHAAARGIRGEQHPDTCAALAGVAQLLHKHGRLVEAEVAYRQVLAALRCIYAGPNQPEATTLDGLAAVRSSLGAHDEAEQLVRESLSMRRRLFGDRHEDVATCLDDLSILLARRGKLDEAVPMAEEALSIRRDALGPDDIFVALSLDNTAFVYRLKGEFDRAASRSREALAMRERVLGADNRTIAATAAALAEALVEQGLLSDAEAAARRALAVARLHEKRPHVLARRAALLGRVLFRRREFAAAEPALLEACELLPPGARGRRAAIEAAIALYDAWEKPDDAAVWRAALKALANGNDRH